MPAGLRALPRHAPPPASRCSAALPPRRPPPSTDLPLAPGLQCPPAAAPASLLWPFSGLSPNSWPAPLRSSFAPSPPPPPPPTHAAGWRHQRLLVRHRRLGVPRGHRVWRRRPLTHRRRSQRPVIVGRAGLAAPPLPAACTFPRIAPVSLLDVACDPSQPEVHCLHHLCFLPLVLARTYIYLSPAHVHVPLDAQHVRYTAAAYSLCAFNESGSAGNPA